MTSYTIRKKENSKVQRIIFTQTFNTFNLKKIFLIGKLTLSWGLKISDI